MGDHPDAPRSGSRPAVSTSAVLLLAAMVFGAPGVASAQEDYVVLHQFVDSLYGTGALTEGADGNLYGVRSGGVYRLARDGSFAYIGQPLNDPIFGLIAGSDGYLYGNSTYAVYRIELTGDRTTLASFNSYAIDGSIVDSIIEGDDGNFYGIARIGSFEPATRIFQVTPGGAVSTVHLFAPEDRPYAGGLYRMTKGRDGYFYGTTGIGGAGYHGTIFQFRPGAGYTTLHTFTGAGGSVPLAPMVEAEDGVFYGTTQRGGAKDHGTIFRFRPGLEFTVLHSFEDLDDSVHQLTVGSDGLVYGVRKNEIYRISPTGDFRLLHRRRGPVEAERWGWGLSRVVQWHDGNFYGTAQFGAKLFRLNRERTACANELSLFFPGTGTDPMLRINHVFKTESAAIAGLFLVSQAGVQPIWFSVVPPVTPTIVYELLLSPFPSIGTVSVYSFVITSDLRTCADSATIETGGPAAAASELHSSLTTR